MGVCFLIDAMFTESRKHMAGILLQRQWQKLRLWSMQRKTLLKLGQFVHLGLQGHCCNPQSIPAVVLSSCCCKVYVVSFFLFMIVVKTI